VLMNSIINQLSVSLINNSWKHVKTALEHGIIVELNSPRALVQV